MGVLISPLLRDVGSEGMVPTAGLQAIPSPVCKGGHFSEQTENVPYKPIATKWFDYSIGSLHIMICESDWHRFDPLFDPLEGTTFKSLEMLSSDLLLSGSL